MKARIFESFSLSFNEIMTVTTDAMNSSRLIDTFPIRCCGILHCQARPSWLNPPIPYEEASDQQIKFGSEYVIFGIDAPEVLIMAKNSLNSSKSSTVLFDRF